MCSNESRNWFPENTRRYLKIIFHIHFIMHASTIVYKTMLFNTTLAISLCRLALLPETGLGLFLFRLPPFYSLLIILPDFYMRLPSQKTHKLLEFCVTETYTDIFSELLTLAVSTVLIHLVSWVTPTCIGPHSIIAGLIAGFWCPVTFIDVCRKIGNILL